MCKKGSVSQNQFYSIVRLVFVILIVFFIFQTISSFIKTKTDIFDIETNLIIQRYIFDNNSISYIDESTGRVMVGIVDQKKVTQEYYDRVISKSISFDISNPHYSGKVTLKDLEDNIISQFIINKVDYEVLGPLALAARGKNMGKGAATINIKHLYVLYKEGEETKEGILRIDSVIPND